MIRIYFASKLHHSKKWRNLCEVNNSFIAHARWLKHDRIGTLDSPENAARFWIEDEEDIRTADAVIVYAEGDEHLRGALVEVGIAIANHVPVIVVGDHPDYGTWQHHPMVVRARDLEDAVEEAIRQVL